MKKIITKTLNTKPNSFMPNFKKNQMMLRYQGNHHQFKPDTGKNDPRTHSIDVKRHKKIKKGNKKLNLTVTNAAVNIKSIVEIG